MSLYLALTLLIVANYYLFTLISNFSPVLQAFKMSLMYNFGFLE